uniref:Uncharacterized protein n=1 Tax=Opuntia streptacantha TaxID=393608 RepID=A0A7C9AS76_OPUST
MSPEGSIRLDYNFNGIYGQETRRKQFLQQRKQGGYWVFTFFFLLVEYYVSKRKSLKGVSIVQTDGKTSEVALTCCVFGTTAQTDCPTSLNQIWSVWTWSVDSRQEAHTKNLVVLL